MREHTNGSILIISHQERILNIADEIVLISGGKVTTHGRADSILPELLSGTSSDMTLCSKFHEGGQSNA